MNVGFKIYIRNILNLFLVILLLSTNVSLTSSISAADSYKNSFENLAPKSMKNHISTSDILGAYVRANGAIVTSTYTKAYPTYVEYILDTIKKGKRVISRFFLKQEIKELEPLNNEISIEDFSSAINEMNSTRGVLKTSHIFELTSKSLKSGVYELTISDKNSGELKNVFNLSESQLKKLQKTQHLALDASENTLSEKKNVEYILTMNDFGMLTLDVKIKIENGDLLKIDGNDIEVIDINTGREEVLVAVIDKSGNRKLENIDRYLLEQKIARDAGLRTIYHITSEDSFLAMLNNNFSIVASRIGTSLMDKYIYEQSSDSKEEVKQNRLNRIITSLDYMIIKKFPKLRYFELWGSKKHPLQYNRIQAFLDSSRGRNSNKKLFLVFNEQKEDGDVPVAGKKMLQPEALKVCRSDKSLSNLSRIIIDNSNNTYSESEINTLKNNFQIALNQYKKDHNVYEMSDVHITVLDKKVNVATNLFRSLTTTLVLAIKISTISAVVLALYYLLLYFSSNPLYYLLGSKYYLYISFFTDFSFFGIIAGLSAYLIELKDILIVAQIISIIKKSRQKIESKRRVVTNLTAVVDAGGSVNVSKGFQLLPFKRVSRDVFGNDKYVQQAA